MLRRRVILSHEHRSARRGFGKPLARWDTADGTLAHFRAAAERRGPLRLLLLHAACGAARRRGQGHLLPTWTADVSVIEVAIVGPADADARISPTRRASFWSYEISEKWSSTDCGLMLLLIATTCLSLSGWSTTRATSGRTSTPQRRLARPVQLRATPAPLGEGEWEVTKLGDAFYGRAAASSLRVNVAGKEMTFSTGVMARQASGAVTCVQGDSHVFTAACFERKDEYEAIDFTPLRVDYFERQSSAGRTLGGYIKRDGRPSAHETLTSRLIDRPIRPLIAKGWSLETQLTAYVLAYDGTNMPDVLAMTSSSAALALSEVPFPKPTASVRVGLIEEDAAPAAAAAEEASGVEAAAEASDDEFLDELVLEDEGADEEAPAEAEATGVAKGYRLVVNPTRQEMEVSKLNLVLAGTSDAVLMVEGFCDFLPEEVCHLGRRPLPLDGH